MAGQYVFVEWRHEGRYHGCSYCRLELGVILAWARRVGIASVYVDDVEHDTGAVARSEPT